MSFGDSSGMSTAVMSFQMARPARRSMSPAQAGSRGIKLVRSSDLNRLPENDYQQQYQPTQPSQYQPQPAQYQPQPAQYQQQPAQYQPQAAQQAQYQQQPSQYQQQQGYYQSPQQTQYQPAPYSPQPVQYQPPSGPYQPPPPSSQQWNQYQVPPAPVAPPQQTRQHSAEVKSYTGPAASAVPDSAELSQTGPVINPGGSFGPKPTPKRWQPKGKAAEQDGQQGGLPSQQGTDNSINSSAHSTQPKVAPRPQQPSRTAQQQPQSSTSHGSTASWQQDRRAGGFSPASGAALSSDISFPDLPDAAAAALSLQASAELTGVKNKMMLLREAADKADARADKAAKDLAEMTQKLYQTQKERDSIQRQKEVLADQVYSLENSTKSLSEKLSLAERNVSRMSTELKGAQGHVDMLESGEECHNRQIHEANSRAAQAEAMAAEAKRVSTKLQMDNDKLDKDLAAASDRERQYNQQLKERDDRIVELTGALHRVQTENQQLERVHQDSKRVKDKLRQVETKAAEYHRHSDLMSREAASVENQLRAASDKERYLNDKLVEVEGKAQLLVRQGERIAELEKDLSVYEENHRALTLQLTQSEQRKHELEQQVKRLTEQNESLFGAQEQSKRLTAELSESQNRSTALDNQVLALNARIEKLEKQLYDQKVAYGELYAQMSVTLKDLQHNM